MAIPVYEEQSFLYEVLLRFGEVDPNKGKLIGASQTKITQLLKDGKLLNSTIETPEQLATLDTESGTKLADVLGSVNAQNIIQNQVLSAALAAEQSKSGALTGDLSTAQAQIQTVTQDLAAASAEIARLKALMPNASLTTDGEPEEPAETV